MRRQKKMILEQETFETFGYHPSDLKSKSSKKILAACNDCGKLRISRKCDYVPLCRNCSIVKVINSRFAVHRMYRFEDLYLRFLSDDTVWKDLYNEIRKKAKEGNPFALNILCFCVKSYNKKVQSAIDLYVNFFIESKNLTDNAISEPRKVIDLGTR